MSNLFRNKAVSKYLKANGFQILEMYNFCYKIMGAEEYVFRINMNNTIMYLNCWVGSNDDDYSEHILKELNGRIRKLKVPHTNKDKFIDIAADCIRNKIVFENPDLKFSDSDISDFLEKIVDKYNDSLEFLADLENINLDNLVVDLDKIQEIS